MTYTEMILEERDFLLNACKTAQRLLTHTCTANPVSMKTCAKCILIQGVSHGEYGVYGVTRDQRFLFSEED